MIQLELTEVLTLNGMLCMVVALSANVDPVSWFIVVDYIAHY